MSRTDRVLLEEEEDYYDLAPEAHLGVDVSSTTLARYRLPDAKGSMWLDVKLPEPVRHDEFVCDRCWLVCHVSREVFWQVCSECA